MKHNRGVRFIINFENFFFHISIIIKKMGENYLDDAIVKLSAEGSILFEKSVSQIFIENGLETIDLDSEFEVIEGVEDEVDTISFYEVETTLKNMLKKFEERIDTIRRKFYESLTENQKQMIKKNRRKSKKND